MLTIILITIMTLGILYFLSSRDNYQIENRSLDTLDTLDAPKPGVVIPPQPRKRPPQPYNPYLKFGDKRKTFFIAPNK